jgi:hypothetical protein
LKQENAWEKYKKNFELPFSGKKDQVTPIDFLNPKSERVSLEISEKRLSICKACPEIISITNQCKQCGCFMNLKTKLEKATCPLGKW